MGNHLDPPPNTTKEQPAVSTPHTIIPATDQWALVQNEHGTEAELAKRQEARQ